MTNCKECHKDACKANARANPDRVAAANKKFYSANKEDYARRASEARKQRPQMFNEINARYRSRKKRSMPSWLTEEQKEQIVSVYAHARDCELVSGESYHVDHIVPLQGKDICGLHVPWNLQVLPADVNISKSNKYEPDENYS
jgi:hypothetical protein